MSGRRRLCETGAHGKLLSIVWRIIGSEKKGRPGYERNLIGEVVWIPSYVV